MLKLNRFLSDTYNIMQHFMRNGLITLLVFILTSCITYQNENFAFISGTQISSIIHEDSLLKTKKPIYFKNDLNNLSNKAFIEADTIPIGSNYKLTKCGYPGVSIKPWYYREGTVNYYYLNTNTEPNIDFIVLYFYKKNLFLMNIFTKKLKNIDLLITSLEKFYNKSFNKTQERFQHGNYYSYRYGKEFTGENGQITTEQGSLWKNRIYIRYVRDYIFDEVSIEIFNMKARPPIMKI